MARTKIRDRGGAGIHGAANETRYKYGLFFSRMLFTALLPSMRRERRSIVLKPAAFSKVNYAKIFPRRAIIKSRKKQLLEAESTVKEISR